MFLVAECFLVEFLPQWERCPSWICPEPGWSCASSIVAVVRGHGKIPPVAVELVPTLTFANTKDSGKKKEGVFVLKSAELSYFVAVNSVRNQGTALKTAWQHKS